MGLVSIFMTGIGLSMDAVAVALAKGISLKKNIFKKSIKIALFFGFFQGIMPLIGWWAGTYFESYIKSIDHWVAFVMLSLIGSKMILESIKGDGKEGDKISDESILNKEIIIDKESIAYDNLNNDNDEISIKDLTLLSIATSIDALAIGISFAFLNVNIGISTIIIGLTTFILSLIAVLIGKKLGCVLQKYSEIFGGILLIGIGLKILIDHLF